MTQPGMPDFRRMQPDQILRALSPILEMAKRTAESGAPVSLMMREAVLGSFLAGRGVAPARAAEMVRQLRRAGPGRELPPLSVRPGLIPGVPPIPQMPGTTTVQQPQPPGLEGPEPALPPPWVSQPQGPDLEMVPLPPPWVSQPETPQPGAPQPETLQPEARPPLNGMHGIPSGVPNHRSLVHAIRQSMGDEASAAIFYTQLMEQIADPALRDYVRHARDDEMKHLRMLEELHQALTGEPFEAEAQPTEFASLRGGLKKAMDNEYEAFEFYRSILLKYPGMPQVVRVFFELMTDELEHATMFNYVLQSL